MCNGKQCCGNKAPHHNLDLKVTFFIIGVATSTLFTMAVLAIDSLLLS